MSIIEQLAAPIAMAIFNQLEKIADLELREQVRAEVQQMISSNKMLLRADAQELLDERRRK